MKKLFGFLSEVQGEFKKVSWPTWEEVNRSTIVVFVAVVLMTLFIYAADRTVNYIVIKVLG